MPEVAPPLGAGGAIPAADLKRRIDAGDALHLLDVREPDEFAEFNLGGHNIPTDQLPDRLQELSNWQNDEIVVVCYYGALSSYASRYLRGRGFAGAKNVEGGLEAYLSL